MLVDRESALKKKLGTHETREQKFPFLVSRFNRKTGERHGKRHVKDRSDVENERDQDHPRQ
jgi:hypothetical protein